MPVEAELAPARSLTLGAPAVALCADEGRLLVLEASGNRVLRLDSTLAPADTVPLTERLVGPAGIAADRFYVYVHDDRTLYRLPKRDPVLAGWLQGVRVAGLAVFAPGEMLVSDAERATVWLKTLFGESRRFLDALELPRPGALAVLPDGMFAALSGGSLLVRFNRAGIVSSRQPLADTVNLMAADGSGRLVLARAGRPELTVIEPDGRSRRFRLAGEPAPSGLAVLPGRAVVLDRDARVISYPLP
ncbi:MAG: hypothetical protein R6X12_10095 [bacterium]